MRKRLLAIIAVLLLLSITAINVFAYTPNDVPLLNRVYPNNTEYYGGLPNSYVSNFITQFDYMMFYSTCPNCGQNITMVSMQYEYFGGLDEEYEPYIDVEKANGYWIFGSFDDLNSVALSGRPNIDFTSQTLSYDREYQCVYQKGLNTFTNFDIGAIPDGEIGYMYRAYWHTENFSTDTEYYNIKALKINNVGQDIENQLISTIVNDVSNLSYNEYFSYNNRLINMNPLESFLFTQGEDDGSYENGYDDGYEVGYRNGNVEGQKTADFFDNGFDNLFEGLFDGFGSFIQPFLSLGWGALTIGSILGFLGVVVVVMMLIKIIRGS